MKTKLFMIIGAFISISFLISSCYKSNNTNYNTTPTSNKVSITSAGYSPASLTVVMGSSVTWTNNDYTTHTVTANDNSFNSGDIAAGHSFTKTFDVQGTFAYHCVYHSTMKATIIIS